MSIGVMAEFQLNGDWKNELGEKYIKNFVMTRRFTYAKNR